jgi:NADPH-dependent curcumin reductase CurA
MASTPTSTRVWILAEPPIGEISSSTFRLETQDLPELKDGQVLVQPTHFSNDPAQRTWMDGNTDPKRLYAPPILKGEPVTAGGIAKVIKSKSSKWKEGQEVSGTFGWYEYWVVDESKITSEAM